MIKTIKNLEKEKDVISSQDVQDNEELKDLIAWAKTKGYEPKTIKG